MTHDHVIDEQKKKLFAGNGFALKRFPRQTNFVDTYMWGKLEYVKIGSLLK